MESRRIKQLSNLSGPPKIASEVLIDGRAEGVNLGTDGEKKFLSCKVTDVENQTALMVCGTIDLSMPLSGLMTAKPIVNIQATIANQ